MAGLPSAFNSPHLYTWAKSGTLSRGKFFSQEKNAMYPATARTQTARSGDKRSNYEAITPPTQLSNNIVITMKKKKLNSYCKVTVRLLVTGLLHDETNFPYLQVEKLSMFFF